MEQLGVLVLFLVCSGGLNIRFGTGLSSEQEGVDLHGLDGDGEALLDLETVVDEREGHLLDRVAEEFRVQLLQADL